MPGAGPHHGKLICGQCRRWLRWLPKAEARDQERTRSGGNDNIPSSNT
jgi:hypothetical protein